MKLNHRFVVPVAPAAAWAAFNDLDGLVPCLPGASLISAEGDGFAGEVKVKLGPISMVYGGTGTFLERDESAGRIVVEAKGKDKRGNGTAGATVTAQLSAEGEGTAVEVTTDLAVTGKPAQFGRAVIQDVSDKLLGQFVECISARLGTPAAGAEETAAGEPAVSDAAQSVAPDTAETASGTAPAARPAGQAPRQETAAAPAELNLFATVMPVLVRRYAIPAAIAAVVIAGVWVWIATTR
jgi:carbon monoxide dehydrogenase subunit G